jgi:hypothetical protein
MTATDKLFLRASVLKARSMRQKKRVTSRGQQNAIAIAIAVRRPSITISEGPVFAAGARIIAELSASPVL